MNNYFKLVDDFETIKTDIYENKEGYFHFIYSQFAYKFPSPIYHPNFYHYASEAWILTLFNQLHISFSADNENLKEDQKEFLNPTFDEMLSKIYCIEIDEELFIENLKILLGTYKIVDHIIDITQVKLSLLFVRKLQLAKELTLSKIISDNINKRCFEELLFLILKRGLNYTLNELDSRENDKTSLLMFRVFTKLTAELGTEDGVNKESQVTLEDFNGEINKIKKRPEDDGFDPEPSPNGVELLNPNQAFYYFAISSFGELLMDIRIFNINSSSIIYKIVYLMKNNILKFRNYFRIGIGLLNDLVNNSRLNSLVNYLSEVYASYIIKQEKAIDNLKKKVKILKTWINESYFGTIFEYTYCQTYKFSKLYLYDTIICPVRDITIFYSTMSVNILIFNTNWAKDKIFNIFEAVQQRISKVFGDGAFVKVSSDAENNYINIEISKHLIIIDFQKFKSILSEIIEDISEIRFIELIRSGEKKSLMVKNYLIKTFKNLLSNECADNKNVEEQPEKSKLEEDRKVVNNN